MMAAAGLSTAPTDPTPGFTMRVRADTIVVSSGTNVSSWTDLGSGGFSYTPFNAATPPTLNTTDSNFNGEPTVTFGGPNNSSYGYNLNTAGTSGNSGGGNAAVFTNTRVKFSIFVVWRQSISANTFSYATMFGCYSGSLWIGPNSLTQISIGNNTLQQTVVTPTTYATHAWNGATTGSANTTLKTTGLTTVVHSSNPSYGSSNSLLIGGGGNSAMYFLGEIAEIIVYPTALTGADASTTEDYLAGRYGLTW